MPERSKRIVLHDEEKLKQINAETQKLMQKYKIDMSLRDLSPKTIYHYEKDLNQWFIYVLDHQFNQSVTELTGIVKKCAVGEYPKSWIVRYQAA